MMFPLISPLNHGTFRKLVSLTNVFVAESIPNLAVLFTKLVFISVKLAEVVIKDNPVAVLFKNVQFCDSAASAPVKIIPCETVLLIKILFTMLISPLVTIKPPFVTALLINLHFEHHMTNTLKVKGVTQ